MFRYGKFLILVTDALSGAPVSNLNPSQFTVTNHFTPLHRGGVYPFGQRALALDGVDYRVMRRTHSSLMAARGIDPKLIADQQGHTVDVNLNVYTRSSIEARIEALETLESAFVN